MGLRLRMPQVTRANILPSEPPPFGCQPDLFFAHARVRRATGFGLRVKACESTALSRQGQGRQGEWKPMSSHEADSESEDAQRRHWLTPGVAGVGAASFFSDTGHEIATSLLPSLVVGLLQGSAATLGLIEGISDALTGLMKLIGGPAANHPDRRRTLASGGYLGTALATGAIGLSAAIWQAGALRALAWLSRGLRTPARDALLASLVSPSAHGRAYGLERAGDNLGAVAGPLLAAGLVSWLGVRPALYLAAIPGLFAALAIGLAAREARARLAERRDETPGAAARLRDARLVGPLVPVAMFELGNVAVTLLILRSSQLLQEAGRSPAEATLVTVLMYAGHNAAGALVALLGGRWVDRSGAQVVFASGAALYVLAYAGMAVPWTVWPPLLASFLLAGSAIGLAETAESALVAGLLPDRLRGSGFGLLGGLQSFGDFASTAVVGLLYATAGPAVGFGYAAAWTGLASLTAFGRLRRG